MAQFKYTALSSGGERVSGVITGFNELDAAARIKTNYKVILKLDEVKDADGFNFLTMDLTANKLNAKAFTVMCNQFAIILKSGIPISRAVELIAEQTTDKPLKRLLGKAKEDVEGGRSLSASFEDHGKKLLPVTFIETVRAGEESGNLDQSFRSMAAHYDKQTKMSAKVRGALAYPAFVLVIAVVVVIVMMAFVIPRFTAIFSETGGNLPGMTLLLIAISDFFRKYYLVLIGAIAALLLVLKLYGNTENGRLNLAKLVLQLPVFGKISLLSAASQFANTMAAMMGAGLPIPKAVSITSKVIDNYYLSQQTGKITEELEGGRSLGATMRDQAVMPNILIDMTSVGEQTGELEDTLTTIAEYYDNELNDAIQSALAKLEPTLLIFIAVIAGFVVISMYMAMFSMYDNM